MELGHISGGGPATPQCRVVGGISGQLLQAPSSIQIDSVYFTLATIKPLKTHSSARFDEQGGMSFSYSPKDRGPKFHKNIPLIPVEVRLLHLQSYSFVI